MPEPKDLDAEKIKNNRKTVLIGSEVLVFDAVDSTNTLAKKYLQQKVQEGLVVIADSQTQGRGRLGRSWHSLPGMGLYLSAVLKPRVAPEHLSQLTLLAGVAAVLTVNEFTSQKVRLKWPNDILINGKKLAGILCEYCVFDNGDTGVILGIGINVNHTASDFPEELRTTATSLLLETGHRIDRLTLTLSLLEHLDQQYQAYLLGGEQGVIRQWAEHTDMFGKKVRITRGRESITGTATGLDSWGNLLLRTETGEEMAFDSGEVSLDLSG